MALTAQTTNLTTSSNPSRHPLPQRPTYDFAANADSIGLGAAPTEESIKNVPTAAQALSGSNHDVVANRRAIRMANMSAAEVLKAELSGLSPVKPPASKPVPVPPVSVSPQNLKTDDENAIPGFGTHSQKTGTSSTSILPAVKADISAESDADADGDPDPDAKMSEEPDVPNGVDHEANDSFTGIKRKFEEGPGSDDVVDDIVVVEEDDEDAPAVPALKVNADGTVEQEDTVK